MNPLRPSMIAALTCEVYPCLFFGKKRWDIMKAPLKASYARGVEFKAIRKVRRYKIGLAKAVLRGS